MLGALSNGQKLGLGLVAAVFIIFALVSSFLLPRRDPNFPGRHLFWFVAASVALFIAMLAAVFVFGKEPEEEQGGAEEAHVGVGPDQRVLQIVEKDFSIQIPAGSVKAGTFDVEATNEGTTIHNLVIKGPGVEDKATRDLDPGAKGAIQADLKPGTYELYCSIPGHKDLGMTAKLTVS